MTTRIKPEFEGPNPVMLRIVENASKALVELSKIKSPSAKQGEALAHLACSVAGAVACFNNPVQNIVKNTLNITEILKEAKP